MPRIWKPPSCKAKKPLEPWMTRFGTMRLKFTCVSMPRCASWSPVIAVIEIGTSWRSSSRRRAVTTISSKPPPVAFVPAVEAAVSSPAAAAAPPPTPANTAANATRRHARVPRFIDMTLPYAEEIDRCSPSARPVGERWRGAAAPNEKDPVGLPITCDWRQPPVGGIDHQSCQHSCYHYFRQKDSHMSIHFESEIYSYKTWF